MLIFHQIGLYIHFVTIANLFNGYPYSTKFIKCRINKLGGNHLFIHVQGLMSFKFKKNIMSI